MLHTHAMHTTAIDPPPPLQLLRKMTEASDLWATPCPFTSKLAAPCPCMRGLDQTVMIKCNTLLKQTKTMLCIKV